MRRLSLKNMKLVGFIVCMVILATIVSGCNSTTKNTAETELRPIIVQGPMPIEAEKFAEKLSDAEVEESGNFVFYKGTIDDYPVIVTKTSKGMENTAAATALAIEKYNPIAIINQGTSGGHDPDLHVFDIVLGKRTVNIGSMKTESAEENEGMDPSLWKPMDLMASEGSAGEDPDAEKIRYFDGDDELLAAANAVKDQYELGKVVEGTIGSADLWNNEVDRINWFHEKYGTSVEEMEGAAAAQISDSYNVPFLGIRILSNNKTNNGQYNPETASANQDYVYLVLKEYISNLK
ncbi:5'-methylthioadenosine nucleosidase [Sporosarcina sp. P26b]|uniref:5'-methylthioadenosine/S-adenosylhomocysteine nucleosidase n=2 Tax=Sporosarcina TaxID=1569 RepID=UPI000C16685A|nr:MULTISPECIES: 5'-methylthioadenosine/S-adenosylhomocysteine nucleosidase [unclassified Sporosarcina]PIC74650.1 5'-methylthioadenosine nucleosidase [Sporosarcina sp. P17b]PIC95856.1 5'-methylthioadenosine nucleosidase [Sporosarcina sp. P26b]